MKIKKKIEGWLKKERLTENSEFRVLYREYQDARKEASEAKQKLRDAKTSYHAAFDQHGDHYDQLPELMMQFRREKYMSRYHREGFRLVKHRFQRWVNKYLKGIIDNPSLATEIKSTGVREAVDTDPKRPARAARSTAKKPAAAKSVTAAKAPSTKPAKMVAPEPEPAPKSTSAGSAKPAAKSPGRPPKTSAAPAAVEAEGPKRRPGRPRKSETAPVPDLAKSASGKSRPGPRSKGKNGG